MRHPVLTAFAMMSFIGAGCFAMACAKDGPEIEPITGIGSATPADDPDSGVNKTITIPTKDKKKKDAGATTPPAVVDAGPADTGAPPAGDDDDDDDDDVLVADCPNDQAHILSWTLASTMGGTECTSHGNECSSGECCFVYPIPGLGQNYCIPQ